MSKSLILVVAISVKLSTYTLVSGPKWQRVRRIIRSSLLYGI